MSFDKFGARVFCRFCRSRNFRSDHHPNECYTCRRCGIVGHTFKECQDPEKRSNTPRRSKEVDNRSNLLPGIPVSLDVEKVQSNGYSLAGWVVVCQHPIKQKDRKRDDVIYSAKIRRLKSEVTSYATPWSGLARLDLSEQSIPLEKVRDKLKDIFRGRTVVGIGLEDDLRSLDLSGHVSTEQRFDFLDHFRDQEGKPINLRTLAYAFLGKLIQEFSPNYDPETVHDAVIDSRITIKIYNQRKHPNNAPIGGTYQWTRNLVHEAIESGQIVRK